MKYTREQVMGMNAEALDACMAEIRAHQDDADIDVAGVTELVDWIAERRAQLRNEAEQRAALRRRIAGGEGTMTGNRSFADNSGERRYTIDSPEYRSGLLKGLLDQELTEEERSAVSYVATTGDNTYGAQNVLPSQMLNKIWDLIDEQHPILNDITMYHTGTILEIAKRTAISHTIMNTFGVCWVLAIFPLFLRLVGGVVSLFGLPDPNSADLTDAANAAAIQTSLLYSVCTMHTLFNVVNTLILVWFIPFIEKLCCMIFPSREDAEEEVHLKYITGGPLSTAELSLDAAKQEVIHFAEVCYRGFGHVRSAINETDPEKVEERGAKLVKYEEITDKIEYEIATFLNEVSKGEISSISATRIKAMYKIIGEMESLGDSGEAVSRILARSRAHKTPLDAEMLSALNNLMDKVDAAYVAMIANLKVPYRQLRDISNAQNAEHNINETRNLIREAHIANIEKSDHNYLTGVYYMDLVAELEKMGDFMINVSEAIVKENA